MQSEEAARVMVLLQELADRQRQHEILALEYVAGTAWVDRTRHALHRLDGEIAELRRQLADARTALHSARHGSVTRKEDT